MENGHHQDCWNTDVLLTSVTVLGQGDLQARLEVSPRLSNFHLAVRLSAALIAFLLLLGVADDQVSFLRYLLLPLISNTLFPDIYNNGKGDIMEEISSDCSTILTMQHSIVHVTIL